MQIHRDVREAVFVLHYYRFEWAFTRSHARLIDGYAQA